MGKLAKVKHKSPTTWQWGRNWIGIPEAFRDMSHSKGGNEFLEKVEKKATSLQGWMGGLGLPKPLTTYPATPSPGNELQHPGWG